MDGLRLASSPSKGRHLLAARPFRAGQLVLEQDPSASALYDEQALLRCDDCLRLCPAPQRCGRCKLARYCGREHQKRAWDSGHREECASLVACAPRVPPASVRLAARLLWRSMK